MSNDLKTLSMKELYKQRDQFLRDKERSAQLAFSYDQEIERRKESGNHSLITSDDCINLEADQPFRKEE